MVTSLSGTYKVSKRDGLLEDYRQVLMLLPLNSTGRGIQMVGDGQDFEPYNPVCTNWVATSIEKREEEDQIEIVVRGQYQEAEGEWRYRILSTGEVSIAYDFKVLKEVSPRQIGVVLSLPAPIRRQGKRSLVPPKSRGINLKALHRPLSRYHDWLPLLPHLFPLIKISSGLLIKRPNPIQ